MTDNIEWGEWVAASLAEAMCKTAGRHCELRFNSNDDVTAYRIGIPRQPVVTTKALYWRSNDAAGGGRWPTDTHRITITLHDGKPVAIAIEELK